MSSGNDKQQMNNIVKSAIKANKIPPEMYEAAMEFMEGYVQVTPYFNGGDILEAFRATGHPESQRDWRNKWGAMVTHGRTAGLYKKVGLSFPTTSQSHTKTLSRWRSQKFIGDMPDYEVSMRAMLKDLAKQVRTGADSLEDVLWKAYVLGKESRA